MGGCATKPKELKTEAADAPAPALAPVVKEDIGTVSETTKEIVVEGEVVDKDKEIVQDETVDEQGSRRRSLSHLFKEKEEGKDSAEIDKTPLEPVKQEEPSVTEKAIDVCEIKPSEAEKAENTVEQSTTPVVVDVPVKAETEKANEATPVTETQKPETLAEEKKTVEEKPVAETQTYDTDEKAIDVYKTKPPEAEKAENTVGQTTTPIVDVPVKVEKERANEAAPVTETQKPETLAEEKKTVEEKPVAESQAHDTDEKKEEK
ncbi:hypothetical protein F0562_005706 [Nyssa sinensis]|uniref:Uncharacterized protein n=1 Tax=Nyssa sinensis TaxID=561372 RepID=A0A5J5AL84_9ASTE|nr:hypothetical protein F0562_005706 [Nyssa sinensis]